jgi:hypothetical protein
VRILGYQPSRRSLLRTLTQLVAAAPLAKLGQVVGAEERRRRRHPTDLPPMPWIGHC